MAALAAAPDAELPVFDAAQGECDVLVVGGTPAGVAAALAAARRGAQVILVEGRPHLGGDMVYAMLNMFDVPARPGKTAPVHGIFAEFFHQLGMACDVDRARHLFENAVAAQPGLRAYVRTRVARIVKDGDRVTGVVLRSVPAGGNAPFGGNAPVEREVAVRAVVDATDDASFAARAGAGYYLGRENAHPDKRMQSASLLFAVAGVDWNQVRYYARGKRPMRAAPRARRRGAAMSQVSRTSQAALRHAAREARTRDDEPAFDAAPAARTDAESASNPPGSPSASGRRKRVWLRRGGAHGGYAWERGDIVRNYRPRGRNLLFLSINFGRQSDGTVVLNTLNIVNVNGLDAGSRRRAYREAAQELPRFVNYLRRAMPGFEKARLACVAPELYIRETRHIHGHYALKAEDVRAERRFFDRVALVSYPLDLHPYVKGQTNPFGPRRYLYTLPLRALVPRKVDGVFVASRSLSATYSAAGSARVIPITMAAGEAAGAASWLCATRNVTPHGIMNDSRWVKDLQASLRDWGADIGDGPFDKAASDDEPPEPPEPPDARGTTRAASVAAHSTGIF